jgi:hypothetical protein
VDRVRRVSFDVLEELHKLLGHRVKLDQLAKDTLGKSKSADGVEAVGWWRAIRIAWRFTVSRMLRFCATSSSTAAPKGMWWWKQDG